jgi:small subunit ribosomal protein S6
MRTYEVVCVLAPTLTDEEVDQSIDGFRATAEEKGAQLVNVDNWGKRRLAFPVKKHSEGVYIVLTLEENASAAVDELERKFKVTESVIRFLSVRVDQAWKRAEKFKVRREARQKRRPAEPLRGERERAEMPADQR